jgi:TRAP-type C4-dicarboxylate transport system substrate-binding protein
VPGAHSTWSREPIRTASDFKGKRIRSLLAIGDAVAKMGGTPVAMAFPDGLEAVSRGAVDGFANAPFDLGVTSGLHKVTKYVTDGGRMGTFAASASVINLRKWKALPADVQKTMLEVAGEVPKCFFDIVKHEERKAVDTLGESKQVEVITFAPEESKKLRETVGRQLWQEWVQLITKQGHDGQKLLDRYLELVAKYEKESDYETGFELYKKKYGK